MNSFEPRPLRNIERQANRQNVGVGSQSHRLKFANDDLENEVEGMPGNAEKVEEAAEKSWRSNRQRP
jgi:hypothetical protein